MLCHFLPTKHLNSHDVRYCTVLAPGTAGDNSETAHLWVCRDEATVAGSSRCGDSDLLGGAYSNRASKYSFGCSSLGTARYGKAVDGALQGSASVAPALRSVLRTSSPGRADLPETTAVASPMAATEPTPAQVSSGNAADASHVADPQQSSGATQSEAPVHPRLPDAELATPPISTRARRAPVGSARSGSPLASRPRFTTGSGRHTFDRALAEEGM